MYFGPSHPIPYPPHAGGQAVPYQTQDYSSFSDSLLYSPHLPSLINESYGIQSPDQYDSGLVTHLDVLAEDLIHESKGDPLESFFLGKKAFLAKSVEGILGLIYEREHMKYESIRKIDYESCQTKSKIFELESCPTGRNPNIDKLRTNIDRDLMAFEREKRMEEVACWRDTCRLKSELREVMGDVTQEKRRELLISGES